MPLQRAHNILMDTKCFVQARRIEAVAGLHRFRIKGDRADGYTEFGRPLYGRSRDERAKLSTDVIRYNHYFTRSLDEFSTKLQGTDARGPRWSARPRPVKQVMFDLIERLAEEDHLIERLLIHSRLVEAHFDRPAPKQRAGSPLSHP